MLALAILLIFSALLNLGIWWVILYYILDVVSKTNPNVWILFWLYIPCSLVCGFLTEFLRELRRKK